MEKNTEELVRELELMKEVVTKNPCGEDRKMFGWIAKGIWRLVKPHMRLSMEQVARYMRVDARTIRRWQKDRGFPQGHRTGHHEVSFFCGRNYCLGAKNALGDRKGEIGLLSGLW